MRHLIVMLREENRALLHAAADRIEELEAAVLKEAARSHDYARMLPGSAGHPGAAATCDWNFCLEARELVGSANALSGKHE